LYCTHVTEDMLDKPSSWEESNIASRKGSRQKMKYDVWFRSRDVVRSTAITARCRPTVGAITWIGLLEHPKRNVRPLLARTPPPALFV
jgi:hypothetical protein